MRTKDVFVLGRSFRDVVKDLEEKKFKVLIPLLKGKRKLLPTGESNQSRFVTKMRWVVETFRGMLKQKYCLLDHKIDKKSVPNIRIYFRVASFLNNAYGQRLQSNKELLYKILHRMRQALYLGRPLDPFHDDTTDRPVVPHVEYQWMGAPMIGPRRSVQLGVRCP